MTRDEAYREAEKKIEAARPGGIKKLSFYNMKLSDIPASLGKIKQLQSLDLSYNSLTTLPEWLGQLTDLQLLDISGNQLTEIPKWIGNLNQLRLLDISSNFLEILPENLTQLILLQSFNISNNQLTELPEWLGQLLELKSLDIVNNKLSVMPITLDQLVQLRSLNLASNNLTSLPEIFGQLIQLQKLDVSNNQLKSLPILFSQRSPLFFLNCKKNELKELPNSLGQLRGLRFLDLSDNQLSDLPASLVRLDFFDNFAFNHNPFNRELAVAYKEGSDSLKAYLRAKAAAQNILNESKLIIVGEGEVGKTCLMDALLDNKWQEHSTTHGIEIKTIKVTDPENKIEITLNGWDFGGQRVYRPTHQLFFSAPAVYLVVWKPREGPQQGFVKEWIKLVKHREPDAKILVVATHGGPGQRQPDIDRQELRDLFGENTVLGFFHIESKPDDNGQRRGIGELKNAIAQIAAKLPEMGRSVPRSFQDAREALRKTRATYLPFDKVLAICHKFKMDDETARLFITISHRLGHLIHYQHDPTLRDIVILKPDWLASAISYVLDDEETRNANGLVSFSRLGELWNDPTRDAKNRYAADLHPIFLRLMERFDLSYRVAGLRPNDQQHETSLIAQLVPDNRPEAALSKTWPSITPNSGDIQQVQICRIVDAQNGQSAAAEGLFYQLIVRLHKYSLGRMNYYDSIHWQRGLVLDDDYNGRALLEYIGNDVRITVRAPYPERFLAMLTGEVKYLVDSFWEGLHCDVMVPCIHPCGKNAPGTGLFPVEKLIKSKKNAPKYPCPVCDEWQDIDALLRNAPAVREVADETLFAEFSDVKRELATVRHLLSEHDTATIGRFDTLDISTQRILSRVDDAYSGLMQTLIDEAKEGPRLFSLVPVDRSNFNPKQWTSAKFRLTLWCEHSRLPLPTLNEKDSKKGVYEIELTREWFKKAAPFLKVLTSTLSLVLPVASSGIKLALDDTAYKAIEEQLDFGKDIIDASLSGSEKVGDWLGSGDTTSLQHGEAIRAQGAILREFQALLKAKDPGFGGLVRVMNKRQEFLWVHERFASEY